MPTPHAHHARRTAGTLLVVLALAGCASGNTPAPAPPTPAASAQPVVADPDIPINYRVAEGTGYRVGVPGSFEERSAEFAGGLTAHQWTEPHPGTAVRSAITVVREPHPVADANRQGAALEQRLREDGIEVERVGLDWPGARSAQLVSWREALRGSGGQARQIHQLLVQVETGPIYSVVVFAPEDAYDTSGLPRALTTFAVRP